MTTTSTKNDTPASVEEIMATMSAEIEALAVKDSEDKEKDKEQKEMETLMNEQMSSYKSALENTLESIMEGKDE